MPQLKHAPYPPTTAGLGGQPTKGLDDPITSVFLVLFVFGAVMHMVILQVNMRRKKKFIMSGLLFGFCMARIVACTMRLVWSTHLLNVSIAIAAQIFMAAGVFLLFIVNLVFAQRILRASHPEFAWAKWFSIMFKLYYASLILMLIALITCTVQAFYTLSTNTKRIDRNVQLAGGTYFAVAAFLPFPLMAINYLLPRKTRVDKFGTGRFRHKVCIVLFAAFLLTLGAAFRAGIAYVPRPARNPAWYHSKACFYTFNFTIEIIVVYVYAIIRVDKRFHVPDGSRAPGDYARDGVKDGPINPITVIDMVNDEEEFFDAMETLAQVDAWDRRMKEKKHTDIEAHARSRSVSNATDLSGATKTEEHV
jgi:hypothetical protein